MIIPDINSLKGSQFTEKHFRFHYPEFLEYLNDKYKDTNLTFQEKLYWYFNNISTHPICKCCGIPTKFINARVGYQEYCSYKCLNSDPKKKKKVEETCMKKYGTKSPAQNCMVMSKMISTNLKRYGVMNAMQNKDIAKKSHDTNIERYGGMGNASEELKNKYLNTCDQIYGGYPMKADIVKEKVKITLIEKYGVTHQSLIKEVQEKISKSRRNTEINKRDFLIGYTIDGEWICKCPHDNCNKCTNKYFIITPGKYENRLKDHTEICTNLLPISADNTKNTSIEIFVHRILDEYNIKYKTNVRGMIDGQKELDIYIPEKQFAIECNGVLSHCDKYKDKKYHENKTKQCNDKGIRLLHIWEDWIRNKPDIVRSMILSKLGLSENRIYARNCVIEKCYDKKEYLDFFEQNHIQGKSGFEIGYGLRYNGKLVSIMTFGHKRGAVGARNEIKKEHEYELLRFCSILNTQVIGAASKLFKHFISDYDPDLVYSYASNDISDGNVYKQLGFESVGVFNSSYWYIKLENNKIKRYHRTSFTKDSIVKKGIKDKNDNTWTEYQAMNDAGYLRIYDSGQTRWNWVKSSKSI